MQESLNFDNALFDGIRMKNKEKQKAEQRAMENEKRERESFWENFLL